MIVSLNIADGATLPLLMPEHASKHGVMPDSAAPLLARRRVVAC